MLSDTRGAFAIVMPLLMAMQATEQLHVRVAGYLHDRSNRKHCHTAVTWQITISYGAELAYLVQCSIALGVEEVDVELWMLDQKPIDLSLLTKSSVRQ